MSIVVSRPRRPARPAPARGSLRRPGGQGLGQPQVHRERHQVLLRTVVDVALQPAALGVLGVDQSLPRHPQLLGPRRQLDHAAAAARPAAGPPCSTSPACAARPANSRSSTGVSGWPVVLLQPQHAEHLTGQPHRQRAAVPAARSPSGGCVVRRRRSAARWPRGPGRPSTTATPAPTRAPVPSASTFAIRAGTSSLAKDPVTASENLLSTSYGDGRPPCTTRVGELLQPACTGSKPARRSRSPAPTGARCGESVCPIRAPPPSTTTT